MTSGAPIDDNKSPSVSLDLPAVSVLFGTDRGMSWISALSGKSPSIWIKVAILGASAPLPLGPELVSLAVMESILPNDCERHSSKDGSVSRSLLEKWASGPSLVGEVGAVVTIPELLRLEESNVCEKGERVEVRLGVANPEKDGERSMSFPFNVTAFLALLGRKKLNGVSDEEFDEEVVAESLPERMLLFSLSCLSWSFLARCSPTNSLLGSVHTTSHIFMDACRWLDLTKVLDKDILLPEMGFGKKNSLDLASALPLLRRGHGCHKSGKRLFPNEAVFRLKFSCCIGLSWRRE